MIVGRVLGSGLYLLNAFPARIHFVINKNKVQFRERENEV